MDIEQALIDYTVCWNNTPVYQAARYSLMSSGKRIRPKLAIAAFEAVGGKGKSILPYACGLEMVHASSLITDDIMDNDDYRRGQLACHKKFGLNIALLAPTLLVSEALLLMSNPRCGREMLYTLREMCIGQEAEQAEYKTGSLIRSSVRIGGMVGAATLDQLAALSVYGSKIGYLFQVIDDMLDKDRPLEKVYLDLSCLDMFGHEADELRKIGKFIVERTS